MGRVSTGLALDRGLEAVARHDRRVTIAGLAAVIALSWVYLGFMAVADGSAAMDMASPPALNTVALTMTFVMWTVMMAGMMLPSAAPTILLYAALVRKNGERGSILPGVWIFVGGYLFVWTVFSAAATALQALLEQSAMLTPAMTLASTTIGGATLIAAGLYQLTPLKRACLTKCQNPFEFLITHWRPGSWGTFRMGVEHGAYCVGCCWALMLLLFVAGVMNLAWVALIAAFVLFEKVVPDSRIVRWTASAVLIVSGLGLFLVA